MKKLNGILKKYDSIMALLGTIVGIIGVIVGIIGTHNIVKANQLVKEMDTTYGYNQQATIINNGGIDAQTAGYIAKEQSEGQIKRITKTSDIENLLKDDRYCIPFAWNGSKKEYDELVKEHKTYRNVLYYINE